MFAVVLAPTRELCVQISETFEALGADISLQTVVLMGGMDMATQTLQLAKKPHVIVASPGRLVDHLTSTKGFHISGIKFLVMDEADRLLSMDFGTAIDQILEASPIERQTFLFSATMTSKVSKLQRASLRKPITVEVSSKYDTVDTLVQNYILVPFKFKQTYLIGMLEQLSAYTGIIFVDTCLNAQKMSTMLRHLGFDSACLHGQMNQTQRLHSLNQFRAGNKKLLVQLMLLLEVWIFHKSMLLSTLKFQRIQRIMFIELVELLVLDEVVEVSLLSLSMMLKVSRKLRH